MTRKDYILIAEALRNTLRSANARYERQTEDLDKAWSSGSQNGVLESAEMLADRLAYDNPRFDREHFLAVVRDEKALNSRPGRQS